MKIFNFKQRSPEWYEARRGVITASRVGAFCLEPRKVCLTVPQIKEVLDAHGVAYKGITKRDDLLELLPDYESHLQFTPEVQTLIDETLGDAADGDDQPKIETFWMRRGTDLEPVARDAYEQAFRVDVERVGFCLHDCGLFGCSPDGFVWHREKGLEIKCPRGSTHIEWLRDGKLPDKHAMQVHASMAVTGIRRWDFWSWHPNLPPLHVVTHWDKTTDRLLAGLLEIGAELQRQREEIAQLWERSFAA